MAANQPTLFDIEEWRPVVGYEDRYEISSQGKLRSIARVGIAKNGQKFTRKSKMLSPYIDKDGYRKFGLRGRGKRRNKFIHRMVVEAFVGEIPEGMLVCHNDGNPANNNVVNLRIGDHSDNALDMRKHGTNPQVNRERCSRGHLLEPWNCVEYDKKKRKRNCKACMRAHGRVQFHPEERAQFQMIADGKYEVILRQTGNTDAGFNLPSGEIKIGNSAKAS